MGTASVGGTSLFYEDLGGDGPLCLVLHGGLGLDHTYFRPAFDRLRERTRLVYYDQRSNGRSGRPALETLTMERLADDAAELAEALGAERFVAVGHSYGGFVAQELALRHADRLLGVALIDTTPGQLGATESPDDPQGDPPPPEVAALMATPAATDEQFAELMGRLVPYYLHRFRPESLAALMADTVYSADARTRAFEVFGTWSAVDRLHLVTCPTIVAAGRHDVFTSAAQAERIARRISGAGLHIFEDSGHFPWLEEPEAFWAVLEAWLDRLRSSHAALA